ncbi:hypothetical protein SNEBB_000141 [Seison nebaliae]|nr:hypothetical protein SNEBB_000141 [Seison nebaliae]
METIIEQQTIGGEWKKLKESFFYFIHFLYHHYTTIFMNNMKSRYHRSVEYTNDKVKSLPVISTVVQYSYVIYTKWSNFSFSDLKRTMFSVPSIVISFIFAIIKESKFIQFILQQKPIEYMVRLTSRIINVDIKSKITDNKTDKIEGTIDQQRFGTTRTIEDDQNNDADDEAEDEVDEKISEEDSDDDSQNTSSNVSPNKSLVFPSNTENVSTSSPTSTNSPSTTISSGTIDENE